MSVINLSIINWFDELISFHRHISKISSRVFRYVNFIFQSLSCSFIVLIKTSVAQIENYLLHENAESFNYKMELKNHNKTH